jgi:predicted esterase
VRAAGPPPHGGQPVLLAGRALADAAAAVILVHGRNGTPENIMELVPVLGRPDLAYLAPRAAGQTWPRAGDRTRHCPGTWYPFSFLAPLADNEPGLSSGLAVLDGLLASLEAQGIGPERVALLGFSQGACLSLELAARRARRYGAVAGLSGGLIGPPGTERRYAGSLAGTPVLLGCSDRDPHIPRWRVDETAEVLAAMGARVDARIYPAMGHAINEDEMEQVRRMLADVAGAADAADGADAPGVPPATPPVDR